MNDLRAVPLSSQYPSQDAILADWAEFYTVIGLAAIPLRPDSKAPLRRGWADLPPDQQWQRTHGDCNLGLRCGDGGLIVIDADNRRTSDSVRRWLDGLGLGRVGARSATPGHSHAYLRSDIPAGFSSCQLTAGMDGEVRGPRSQVAAPPSIFGERSYRAIGDVRHIPRIRWRDLARFAGLHAAGISRSVSYAPALGLLRRDKLPASTARQIAWLHTADRGKRLGKYRSRSEVLCAVMNASHSAGWSLDVVLPHIQGIYSDHRLEEDFHRTFASWRGMGRRPRLERLHGQLLDLIPDDRTDRRVFGAAISLSFAGGADGGWMFHRLGLVQLTGLSELTVRRSLVRLMAGGLIEKTERGIWHGFAICPRLLLD